MKNRIYFFTGTGNSLKAAKDIASSLPECEVVAICEGMDMDIPAGLERIGFVFPVYFYGLPNLVEDFVRRSALSKENAKYFFAVATPGGFSGKPLAQLNNLFAKKGIHLDYGKKIRMNANYLVSYGSIGLYYITAMMGYAKHIKAIISDVSEMKTNEIERPKERTYQIYRKYISKVHQLDKGYHTNDACNSCGICVSVCPVKNIKLENGRPVFSHQCESCMACLQYCPKKALNYENKTQKRKRYTHPDIKHTEISKYYKSTSKS